MLRRALQQDVPLDIPALEMVVVEPPSLEGLVVEVAPAQELDEATLLELWTDFLYDRSPRTPRSVIAAGMEVNIRCVAFEDRKVVPFTACDRLPIRAGDDPMLPDLSASLVGRKVGERYVVPVQVPDDYAAPRLRGRAVDFVVEVQGAASVDPLDPGDPGVIEKLGFEDVSLETLLQQIGEGWMEAQLARLVQEAQDRMFAELVARAGVEHVPQIAAETELFLRWKHGEGRILSELAASEAELAWSWAHWAADPDLYQQCAFNVNLGLVLRAVAEEAGMTPEVDDGLMVLARVAPDLDATPEDVQRSLRERPAIAERALDLGFFKRIRDHVLAQVPVHDPNV